MKTEIDHLPLRKQRELVRTREILFDEFEAAMSTGTNWKRKVTIQMVVLFGSYARGTWVDEPHTSKGYQSDFDILVIVHPKKLADLAELWSRIEGRLFREETIKTPVNFIVHTLDDVNDQLTKGRYFFTDIKREGIVLHREANVRLATPRALPHQDAYEMAKEYYEEVFPHAEGFLTLAVRAYKEEQLNKHAVFLLHQATEHAYSALLLTFTLYTPATHKLQALRGFSENIDERLIDIWPRSEGRNKDHKGYFNKLSDAYVKSRYSKHYTITEEALDWLSERVEQLHTLIETICTERLTALKEDI